MTSKLKCPICGGELKHEMTTGIYCCKRIFADCPLGLGTGAFGTKELWQALIQAKQDLEIARKALEHCIKTFRQLEAVLDEKANARDFDDPDLYAWAVRIKPIWLELKEITGTDYKTENK